MIKKSILYFLVVTGLLYGLRTLHYKGLLRNKGYYSKSKTILLEKNSHNVLFLGSSRVEMHYDTGLFDSITGQNSFNLGMPGAKPNAAFAVLKIYLEKSVAPEYLFYEVDYHVLCAKSLGFMNFSNYFPFLSDKTVRTEFNKIDPRMNHFYYNPYYSWPFVGLKSLSTSVHAWLNLIRETDTSFYKGFRKDIKEERPYTKVKKYRAWIETSNRNYIDSIIDICHKKNIKTFIISSPIFGGGKIGLLNKKQVTEQIHNIATINHIQYMDLSSLPFCKDRSLFSDMYHLNYRGARKFTVVLSQIFNNKIKNIPLN